MSRNISTILGMKIPHFTNSQRVLMRFVNRCCKNDIVETQYFRRLSLSSQTLQSVETVAPAQFTVSSPKEIWDLCVGVIVERKPVVTAEMNPMERKYTHFLNQYEIELSKKSDHELRLEKDIILKDKVKSGEIDQGAIQTAQDFEDISTLEFNEFALQSRITEADDNKDLKSLQRALDSHLILLVHQKLGKDFKWLLPQAKRLEGESLRQVAERILKEILPDGSLMVTSNAPWGLYKYKYPTSGVKTEDGKSITGAKVFFYKTQVPHETAPSVNQTSTLNINDYVWLTRSEMRSKLALNYYKSLTEILIHEN